LYNDKAALEDTKEVLEVELANARQIALHLIVLHLQLEVMHCKLLM